jgi:putative transposase
MLTPSPEGHDARDRQITGVGMVVQAPKANAFAERFVGTIRRECLDWVVILSRRQLGTLRAYVEHDNGHRPHRSLGLVPPAPRLRHNDAPPQLAQVRGQDTLGGLIHEYSAAA